MYSFYLYWEPFRNPKSGLNMKKSIWKIIFFLMIYYLLIFLLSRLEKFMFECSMKTSFEWVQTNLQLFGYLLNNSMWLQMHIGKL